MSQLTQTSREYKRGRESAIRDLHDPSELGRRPEWVVFPTCWERSSEDYRQGYQDKFREAALPSEKLRDLAQRR